MIVALASPPRDLLAFLVKEASLTVPIMLLLCLVQASQRLGTPLSASSCGGFWFWEQPPPGQFSKGLNSHPSSPPPPPVGPDGSVPLEAWIFSLRSLWHWVSLVPHFRKPGHSCPSPKLKGWFAGHLASHGGNEPNFVLSVVQPTPWENFSSSVQPGAGHLLQATCPENLIQKWI